MSDADSKKLALFYPDYLEKRAMISSKGVKFAYYTDATTAMKVIQNNEIWLRNTRGMNDYSEVEHGIESFRKAFFESTEGKSFKNYISSIFPGAIEELENIFYGWLPAIRMQTYIACVSMHETCDDDHGRLSMWRAYGGRNSTALIFNNKPFLNDTNALKTDFLPVIYKNDDYARQYLSGLESRMRGNHELTEDLKPNELLGWLFDVCKMMVLCIKHPGFQEEREWRLIYSPELDQSPRVKGSIESLGGVPQQIYKIRFENAPEQNLTNATLAECLDRIIIGPTDSAPLLIDSFRKLLDEAGVQNPSEKVFYSEIPLR